MNLQRDVVAERLSKLREVVRELRGLKKAERETFLQSRRDRWAAERGLQLAAEAVFDVGSHLLVSHFNATPSDYESIIRQLAELGAIDDTLRSRLEGLGGFRNILVHDYLEIDAARVWEYLQDHLDDFVDYASQVEEFVDSIE